MRIKDYEDRMDIPAGIILTIDGHTVTVKGKLGELRRPLVQPGMDIGVQGTEMVIKVAKFTKRDKTQIGTIMAHVRNMMKGVTYGHSYRLKICSGHFPMNVAFTNNQLVVKNFIGEKIPRTLAIDPKVKLKLEAPMITLEGIDRELCGKTASEIEHLTRRANYDRRVFQDGIYITEKDGKAVRA
jgi:large subunit ribosomal protein L6